MLPLRRLVLTHAIVHRLALSYRKEAERSSGPDDCRKANRLPKKNSGRLLELLSWSIRRGSQRVAEGYARWYLIFLIIYSPRRTEYTRIQSFMGAQRQYLLALFLPSSFRVGYF
ncbi:hypothetical protein GYMLUDRAFT_35302 [Collybiopsis luxurians FD-317 M1]|nr:hypothetical protein GYMLUDRAFT_35302 [Collybiopsis luxurians FD-317 M1]